MFYKYKKILAIKTHYHKWRVIGILDNLFFAKNIIAKFTS